MILLAVLICGCSKKSAKNLQFNFIAKNCTDNGVVLNFDITVISESESICRITTSSLTRVQFIYEESNDIIKFVGESNGYIDKNGNIRFIYRDVNITGSGVFIEKIYF